MPLMTWTDKLGVGVKVLDEDHKKLIDLLNQLDDGMKKGKGKETLGKVLDGLVKLHQVPLRPRRRIFAKTGYPSATHKKEHDDLVKQVLELQARYRSGELALSLATVEFVKNWLINHIQGATKNTGHISTPREFTRKTSVVRSR